MKHDMILEHFLEYDQIVSVSVTEEGIQLRTSELGEIDKALPTYLSLSDVEELVEMLIKAKNYSQEMEGIIK